MTDFRDLLDEYLDSDGELPPERQRELIELLAADRGNVRIFVRETHFHKTIREELVAEDLRAEHEKESEEILRESTRKLAAARRGLLARLIARPWALPALAAAAVVLAAAAYLLSQGGYPEPAVTGAFSVAGGGGVGRGATIEALKGAAAIRLGGYVTSELAASGAARIDGAPGDERLFLARGRLDCTVEPGKGSFSVESPAGGLRVTGTSFIAELIEDAGTPRLDVRVLEGSVTVRDAFGERAVAARQSATVGASPVGVVSNVKVLSDKVPDVSSIEAWRRSFIRDGMTDEEKAIAVWRSVVSFHHQDSPPCEYLQASGSVQDPIKTFNVYGYGMCSCSASNIEALARAAGLAARGLGLRQHSVAEIEWSGAWHLLDASMIYYLRGPDGHILSSDEIIADVRKWYAEHPGFEGDDAKLRAFMRDEGWRNGPAAFAGGQFLERNGWLAAATHGWYSLMEKFDGSVNFPYEYGYSQGYRVNVQLHDGERLVRNWSNKGLHVNMDTDAAEPGCLRGAVGKDALRYAPSFGDIAPGRVGNGEWVCDVPLKYGAWRSGALSAENVADGPGGVGVLDPARPAAFVIRRASPYVCLGGELTGTARVSRGGTVKISLSRNNGASWKEIGCLTGSGRFEIDLASHVRRLYDYRLKFELSGAGTELEALRVRNDVQHSQRALPALTEGLNTITFASAPAEGTVTVEGCTKSSTRGGQVLAAEFNPVLDGVESNQAGFVVTARKGSVTFPVETPGDIVRLRLGAHYRARAESDGWDYLVSFDDGRTWAKVGRASGPVPGGCEYASCSSEVPPGSRRALVRFDGSQRNTTCIFDFRIDADYIEPKGGFRPVRITYVWEELGVERRDVHVARLPSETYAIECRAKPLMKSITMELAE